ncbi:hypothetical protein C1H46_024704 [Malus baccata]|uniref:Uncharacterized protein n=1 Tax=Malus baccata TaxID=106549 RepID=A0A540LT72_MALBA|nr:hypothetical protein C1H46_024704 [Malus baccata]
MRETRAAVRERGLTVGWKEVVGSRPSSLRKEASLTVDSTTVVKERGLTVGCKEVVDSPSLSGEVFVTVDSTCIMQTETKCCPFADGIDVDLMNAELMVLL